MLPPTRQYRRNDDWLFVVETASPPLIFYKPFRDSRIRVGEHGKGKRQRAWRSRRMEEEKCNEKEKEGTKPLRGLGYSRLCHGSRRDSRCIISHRSFSWLPGRVENGFQLILRFFLRYSLSSRRYKIFFVEKFVRLLTSFLLSRIHLRLGRVFLCWYSRNWFSRKPDWKWTWHVERSLYM